MIRYLSPNDHYLSDEAMTSEPTAQSTRRLWYDAVLLPACRCAPMSGKAMQYANGRFPEFRRHLSTRATPHSPLSDGQLVELYERLAGGNVWGSIFLLAFPVKDSPSDTAQYALIEAGMKAAAERIARYRGARTRVLVPAPCFCEGLDWETFKAIVSGTLGAYQDMEIDVVTPAGCDFTEQ